MFLCERLVGRGIKMNLTLMEGEKDVLRVCAVGTKAQLASVCVCVCVCACVCVCLKEE